MSNDIINAAFELTAGLLLWLNVVHLHRDKRIQGIHFAPTALFTAWGVWNLYFYPNVGCWWSFVAGILVVVANGTWLGQLIYYRYKQNKEQNHVSD